MFVNIFSKKSPGTELQQRGGLQLHVPDEPHDEGVVAQGEVLQQSTVLHCTVLYCTVQVRMSSISLKSWLNMWARLCRGSAGMDDFPIWVQLLPRVLFNVIVAR